MTEREKMIAGMMYNGYDPELVRERTAARQLLSEFNQADVTEKAKQESLLRKLFGKLGNSFDIEAPFRCDYGWNIRAGEGLFMNFDCVFLDVCPITIGDQCFFAPGVHLYTAAHPVDAAERCSGLEYGNPIRIGNRCWLGGRSIVLPGVTIGDDVVVGAGSVVTRDVPSRSVVAGNPARVLRRV